MKMTSLPALSRPRLMFAAIWAAAALAALSAAWLGAQRIETRGVETLEAALEREGHGWAEVRADGLKIFVSGTAPDEAERFAALGVAGQQVSPARLRDRIVVAPPVLPAAPALSLELLQNGAAVSLIGLVPGADWAQALVARLKALEGNTGVVDLMAHVSAPAEPGWQEAVDFTVTALGLMRDSKISVAAGAVTITAIAASQTEKTRLEAALRRLLPPDVALTLDISAPRPVITPFVFAFALDEDGPRLEACSAGGEEGRARILAAIAAAGLAEGADCEIGLGAPTEDWALAVEATVDAVVRLGGGRVEFSDADLRLVARPGAAQDLFDSAVAGLRGRLPDVFSLSAVLPEAPVSAPESGADGDEAMGFSATRSPEGQVQLRGRVTDPALREAVASFARARFGADGLHDVLRTDPGLPEGWSVRVLAGLEGLAMLRSGSLTVTPDRVALRGVSDAPERSAQVTEAMARMLPEGETPEIDITYDERLDPRASLPTPQECMDLVAAVLADGQIIFDPGSATIDAAAGLVIDRIAEVMRGCAEVEMRVEIGGHTDAQGRDGMNLALSQARAEAVLDALLARGVLTANMTARGYGSAVPVADNATEEGRERNRRIEFRLLAAAEDSAGTAPAGTTVITPQGDRPGAWIKPPPARAEGEGVDG
ncbi:MAG: hypothetical protein CVT80_10435 [Alphaproteobacteria bacterium HGW-Alphaproteobacteria-2]|nr:MAG: hypothetical protein CVT80_10435 [Alphaproteobacteria bacterium HGW-Alphaproteobacteria-2]